MNDFGMDLNRWFICAEKHWQHQYWWVFPSERHREEFGGPQRFEGSSAAFAAFREFFEVRDDGLVIPHSPELRVVQ